MLWEAVGDALDQELLDLCVRVGNRVALPFVLVFDLQCPTKEIGENLTGPPDDIDGVSLDIDKQGLV